VVSFSLESLYAWINAAFLPFVRLLALFSLAPVFGESSLPKRVKIALAALTAMLIAPLLLGSFAGDSPDVLSFSPASWTALWRVAQQVLIGLALGLVMRMAFAAVQTAGELIGLQMGLSFASFFDPAVGGNTAVLARLMNMLAMLLFLSLDGHLMMMQGLIASFDVLPIHGADHLAGRLDTEGWRILFVWSAQILASGLLLALPLVMTLLCISLALGILNRTAQQLSVFSVGFPVSLLIGLTLLMTLLPQLSPPLTRLFHEALQVMWEVVQALAE